MDHINFSNIFIDQYQRYLIDNDKNSENIKIHTIQNRYLEILKFTNNSAYWTRHNRNPITGKYMPNLISGKYLNEIHNFLIKNNFYDKLYKSVLDIYLKLTNYQTLKTLAIDSQFVRNIIGENCNRNPQYYNKPGFKIHSLVDSEKVPISICETSSTVNDSVVTQKLIDSKFVDDKIFKDHVKNLLADTAYSGLLNINNITSKGIGIIMGKNKGHIRGDIKLIKNAENEDIIEYKNRTVVENFFGIIQRYPCIINNYEKKSKSYMGLLLFVMSSYLAKKINKIIDEKNDAEIKIRREQENLKKKEARKIKIEKMKKEREIKQKKNEIEKKQREKQKLELLKKIKNTIYNNLNVNMIKKIYNNRIKNNNKIIKITKITKIIKITKITKIIKIIKS